MTINVAPIKSSVKKAFDLVGENFTLRTTTAAGTFNPATGAFDSRTYTDRTMRGVDVGRESRWVSGTMVTDNQYAIYLYDDGGAAPSMANTVILDGEEVAIQDIQNYKLAGNKLAYRIALVK